MSTTMHDLRNSINELGAKIRDAAAKLAKDAGNPNIPIEDINKQQDDLRALNARLDAMQTSYAAQFDKNAQQLTPATPQLSTSDREGLSAMLASNEYARAFADAIRKGARPSRGLQSEGHKVLFDALTIAGGSPEGSDGGFLVPEDIDRTIRELRRELSPLAELFTEETTNTNSGWRIVDKAPTKGFTALTSEIPTGGIPRDDQPSFGRLDYSLTTYGLIVPVSNELANDEVANLFGYLARWFAKKQTITENVLLKALLEKLTTKAIETAKTDPISALKRTLNRELDPTISVLATIITNQAGFDLLDQIKDETGRPMLQPDPTNATQMRFKGRAVRMFADSMFPSEDDVKHPLFAGDFKEYGTIFRRHMLEVTSTDIGGNAFNTNSIEVRGIARMGAYVFDDKAAVRKTLDETAGA